MSERKRRKVAGRPLAKPPAFAPMSGHACDIAVSEMTSIPLESLCAYIVLAARHEPDGRHTPIMVPSDIDLAKALRLVEQADADLRLIVEGAS